mgnify:CR=1 FL=1
MRCCPCGAWEHIARRYTAENGSVHIQLNGTCRRCPCGWPRTNPDAAYGCVSPGTVVAVANAPLLPVDILPPSWIRAIFRWTVDADGAWTTDGGSIYNQFGGLHLSPMDTAIVSSILERIVPNES